MNDDEILTELNKELNHIIIELNKIQNLKYNNTIEYVKLGSNMCGLIDIQENIMKSYREVLMARIVLLQNKMYEELQNKKYEEVKNNE